MEQLDTSTYHRWLAESGLHPDPTSATAPELVFADALEDLWTALVPPPTPSSLPGFVWFLLTALGEGEPVLLAPRADAPWFNGATHAEGPLVAVLRDRLVGTLLIPPDFRGAIRCSADEWPEAIQLVVSFLVFGGNRGGDLQLIAADRSVVLLISDDEVFVRARSAERLERFLADLPEGLRTFV